MRRLGRSFAGRIHVECDSSATVTPLGQLSSSNSSSRARCSTAGWRIARCITPARTHRKSAMCSGTVMLSALAGHWRYAHMTTLRCDPVNPPLLGMNKVVSEDAVRRGLDKIEESAGLTRLQQHLDYATRPLLSDQAVDTRYRHHREAALRPPGGRRGELQSAQAGTAVAQLSLLHDGQSAPGAGGRGCARQPAYLQALLAAAVGVVGWPGERAAAVADPRRCPVSATSR
jgi:hypothetical protein